MNNEKVCPQCGAPLKRPIDANNLVDSVVVKCEYCSYNYTIGPEMKKTAAAYKIFKEVTRDKRTEEQKAKDARTSLILMIALVVGVILITFIGIKLQS